MFYQHRVVNAWVGFEFFAKQGWTGEFVFLEQMTDGVTDGILATR